MKFSPLTTEEIAKQTFTHRLDFSYRDIPAGIPVTTDHVFTVAGLPAATIIKSARLTLVTAFEDLSDATYDQCLISFGTTNNDDSIFNDIEINRHGTEVYDSFVEDLDLEFAAAEDLTFTIKSDSSTGFTLSNLDKGQFVFFIEIGNENRAQIIDSAQP